MSSILDVLKGIIGGQGKTTSPSSNSSGNPFSKINVNNQKDNSQKKPVGVDHTITFPYLPETAEQLAALPGFTTKDPYMVTAMTILCLRVFPVNRDECYKMLNLLKGPAPLTEREKSFIKDRFMDGKSYIPDSYFVGATPGNDYKPSVPYTIIVTEYATSKPEPNYYKLFLTSGGADNPRFAMLREKPSTGDWFLWNFEGILAGIRIPVSKDAWA